MREWSVARPGPSAIRPHSGASTLLGQILFPTQQAKVPQEAWSTQPPGTLGIDDFLGRTLVLGQVYGTRLVMEFVA